MAGERGAERTRTDDHAGRWGAAFRAVRAWALEHPHEYALIYGSPVPGYSAPRDTAEPAARGVLLLARIAFDAFHGPGLNTAIGVNEEARVIFEEYELGSLIRREAPVDLVLGGYADLIQDDPCEDLPDGDNGAWLLLAQAKYSMSEHPNQTGCPYWMIRPRTSRS